jgi:hypothetical protein
VVKKANGKIAYTAPPPKVGEVTFPAAAAKARRCRAREGALRSGVLKGATKIAGARSAR